MHYRQEEEGISGMTLRQTTCQSIRAKSSPSKRKTRGANYTMRKHNAPCIP